MEKMKIEVGKTYAIRHPEKMNLVRDRTIKITEELKEPDADGFRFIGSDGWTYGDEGNFSKDGRPTAYDLITEIKPETT